jgi:dienelactone hydrolase
MDHRRTNWDTEPMVTTSDVRYEVDDRTMIGRLAVPDGTGPRPAVLIAHEGPGLDDVQRDRAAHLAELGYVAFALDYQGGGRPVDDREAMMARIGELAGDAARVRAIGSAGLDVLRAEPRVDASRLAAIGYCFGGHVVLELARSGADLKAVVGFHSRLSTTRPDDARNITAKVLVCIGSDDPLVPGDQRAAFEEEMRAGDVDWQMNMYGGAVHSFTNPGADGVAMPGVAYDARTDRRSWQAMLDLFAETLAAAGAGSS